jgi:hypothetical protein
VDSRIDPFRIFDRILDQNLRDTARLDQRLSRSAYLGVKKWRSVIRFTQADHDSAFNLIG